MKANGWKLFLVSLVTVIGRIALEFLIPASTLYDITDYLTKSALMDQALFPLYFTIYAFLLYFMLAFLAYRWGNGHSCRILLGLAIIWFFYLMEPFEAMPVGVWFRENILVGLKYSIIDGLALIFMAGLFTKFIKAEKQNFQYSFQPIYLNKKEIGLGTVLYFITVLILRMTLDRSDLVYSSFNPKTLETLVWLVIISGLNIYFFLTWSKKIVWWKALLILLINSLLFNGFMILIVEVDLLSLVIRSSVDYLPLIWFVLLSSFQTLDNQCRRFN